MSLTATAIAAMSLAALTEHRSKLQNEADALAASGDWTPEQEARAAEVTDELNAVKSRLAASEKRTRLAAARATDAVAAAADPEVRSMSDRERDRFENQIGSKKYLDEFRIWLRGGPEPELREITSASNSGVAAPKLYETMLQKYQDAAGPIRAAADVKPNTQGKPTVRVNTQQSRDVASSATTEASPAAATVDIGIEEVTFAPELGHAESKVSRTALASADFDLEAEVIDELMRKCAKDREYWYEVGTGSNQPTGVFKSDSNTVQLAKSASASGTAWATQISYANLLDMCVNQLPAEYWAGAQWYMSQAAYYVCAGLVDGNSRPLLTENANQGATAGPAMTLFGYKVNVCPFAPTKITNAGSNVPIVFGNMSEVFRIHEWSPIMLQRDELTVLSRVVFKTYFMQQSKIKKTKQLCQLKITLT